MSRTAKSVKNLIFTFGGYFITLVLQFISRSIFIKMLSAEYLGLSGLFSNILSILAVSELGIGTAMTYALYKPISDHNTEKIKSLMKLYKRLYTLIGLAIIVLGTLLAPFLQYLVADMPDIPYIRLYYLLYVFNSGISYFYSYKRSLIICDQQSYVSTVTTTIASITTKLLQIIVLYFTGNFMLFLLVQIGVTFAENIWISCIADKKYPFLREKNIEKLTADDKNSIKRNVKGMLFHKISFVIVMATDNLIISKILGLVSVGIYSNYSMIIDNVGALTDKGIYSVSASVGDLIASGDKKKSENVFYKLLFIDFWVSCFCSVSLFCLLQPFIRLWLGEAFLLTDFSVMVIVLCFYFSKMRHTVNIFKESAGIIRQDRYAPVIESILNLILSIPLTIWLGVAGVKLGTLLSTIAVPFWCAAYVLFKYYFGKKCSKYLLLQLKYFVITVICTILTAFACYLIKVDGILGFAIKCLLCVFIPNATVLIGFYKTDELGYLIDVIKGLFIKKPTPKNKCK